MHRLQFPLCVVGHGRGATSFANMWLVKNKVFTQHEMMGTDGIVDSALSVPSFPIRAGDLKGKLRTAFDFDLKVCILRDPYKVIATYYAAEPPEAVWFHEPHISLKEAKGDLLNAIALSVVRWSESGIEYADHTLRVEDQWHEMMPTILDEHDLWFPKDRFPTVIPPNTINHRMGRRLFPEEINDHLNPFVRNLLKQYSEARGYDSHSSSRPM